MGKTADQLNLDDSLLPPTPRPVDLRDTDWYRFRAEIEELLASGQYEWAADTLSSIAESVEKYRTVTEGQRRAVGNIAQARKGEKYGGVGYRRRYEGWR